MKPSSQIPASRLNRACALLAAAGVGAFALIVAAEHAINSSLDPTIHEISEYVHGRLGPLMTVGFVCWAIALAATSWLVQATIGARLVAVTVGLASVGVALTAGFSTETSAGRLPRGAVLTATGRLHDVGSGLATVSLLIAAVASIVAFAEPVVRRVFGLLVAAAVSSDVALLVVGPSVAGVRQRVLVACACTWQVLLVRAIALRSPAGRERRKEGPPGPGLRSSCGSKGSYQTGSRRPKRS